MAEQNEQLTQFEIEVNIGTDESPAWFTAVPTDGTPWKHDTYEEAFDSMVMHFTGESFAGRARVVMVGVEPEVRGMLTDENYK